MYWMTHADHGTTTAYDTGEKKHLESLGWKLLNEGDSPIHAPKAKPVDMAAAAKAEKEAMNAALSRLSQALGNPAIEGEHLGVALIDFAVGVLSQHTEPTPMTAGIEESRVETAPVRNKPGRKPRSTQ